MPILTVDLVADELHAPEHNLAQSLADAVGRALDSPPGQTWVRLRLIGRNQYAENESTTAAADWPVFVTVLKQQVPVGPELQAEVTALTRIIAQVIGRAAACVHIEYAPAAAGRVSFGGKLVQ